MGGSFKLGRLFGIDVKVHWTFFLLLAFFAFLGYQGAGNVVGALVTIALIVMLFLSVLLHEYGHSLVVQRLGIEIKDITLLPIGGVSNMRTSPETPSEEAKITLAGPLDNVVLAPLFFGIGLGLGANPLDIASPLGGFSSAGQFFVYLGYINAALAVFNLLPAFPMDGGRVLRGLLTTRLGRLRATDIASTVGQVFAADTVRVEDWDADPIVVEPLSDQGPVITKGAPDLGGLPLTVLRAAAGATYLLGTASEGAERSGSDVGGLVRCMSFIAAYCFPRLACSVPLLKHPSRCAGKALNER